MFGTIWYKTLIQPPLTPPAWVFAPAWSFLYITIFLALFVYGIKPYFGSKSWGFALFFIQFLLNMCWSPVFFLMHNTGLALAIVVLMDILVILNIVEFYKVSVTAGNLMLPYIFWLLFATYLNAGFFVLN
jgi:Tryptophan-rich sensory protein (mitochondrial benzodiazepine receptor homolog)